MRPSTSSVVGVLLALLTFALLAISEGETTCHSPSCFPPPPPVVSLDSVDPSTVDVYICAGQSNMVGGAGNPPSALNQYSSPLILQLGLWPGSNLSLVNATEPLQMPFTNPSGTNVGPCMSFVSSRVNATGRLSIIVPAACQSTGFTTNTNVVVDTTSGTNESIIGNWTPLPPSPASAPYMFTRLVTRASYLQSKGYRLASLLWLQGEADTGTQGTTLFWGPTPGTPAQSTANHTADLVRLFRAVRTALQSPTLPLVVLQMSPGFVAAGAPGTTQIQDSIDSLPWALPYTAAVRAVDPHTGAALGDADVHYKAAPQRVLGLLAGVAYEAAVSNHEGSRPGPVLPSPMVNRSAAVQWAPNPRAVRYEVHVEGGKGGEVQQPAGLGIGPIPLLSYTVTGQPTNGSVWRVRVRAVNDAGAGPFSPVVALHPQPPTAAASPEKVETRGRREAM